MKKVNLLIAALILLTDVAAADGLYLTSRASIGARTDTLGVAVFSTSPARSVVNAPYYNTHRDNGYSVGQNSLFSGIQHVGSGSRYAAQVAEVGQSAPTTYGKTIVKRREGDGPPQDDDDYDPNNPQFGALPDGVGALLILALLFYLAKRCRIRKLKKA